MLPSTAAAHACLLPRTQIITRLDKNGDGVVNFEEFQHWYLARRKVVDVQVTRRFSTIAKVTGEPDDNATIDAEGARMLLKKVRPGRPPPPLSSGLSHLRPLRPHPSLGPSLSPASPSPGARTPAPDGAPSPPPHDGAAARRPRAHE